MKLTTEQKLAEVSKMIEIRKAVSILILAFKDCNLKSHIRFAYETEANEKFEITFLQLVNEVTIKGVKPIK